jgi:hypothetical protein
MPIQSQTPHCHPPASVSLDRPQLERRRGALHAGGWTTHVCSSATARRDGPTTSSRRNPHRAPDGKTKTFHLIWLSRKKGDQVLPPRQRRTGMMISASVSLLLPLSLRIVATLPFLDLPLPPPLCLGVNPLQRRDGRRRKRKLDHIHPSILVLVSLCTLLWYVPVPRGRMPDGCMPDARVMQMRDGCEICPTYTGPIG